MTIRQGTWQGRIGSKGREGAHTVCNAQGWEEIGPSHLPPWGVGRLQAVVKPVYEALFLLFIDMNPCFLLAVDV